MAADDGPFRVLSAYLHGMRRFAVIDYIGYFIVPLDTLGIGNRVVEDGYQWELSVSIPNPYEEAVKAALRHFSEW